MTSNAWTPRRQTFRRPPVCKSKPNPDDQRHYPNLIHVDATWTQINGMDFNDHTNNDETGFRVGVSAAYFFSFLNDQAATIEGDVTIGVAPAQSTISLVVMNGPFAGELIGGFATGWDGVTSPFSPPPQPLTGSMPFFNGQWTYTLTI